MQEVCDRLVSVTGEDLKTVHNRFRTWVSTELITDAERSGSGRGTRRRYDDAAVFKAAVLMRLAQLGMAGDDLREKLELIEPLQDPEKQKALATEPCYLIGRPPSAKGGGFLITAFADDLKDVEMFAAAGVGYWVDVGMIHRELAKLSQEAGSD